MTYPQVSLTEFDDALDHLAELDCRGLARVSIPVWDEVGVGWDSVEQYKYPVWGREVVFERRQRASDDTQGWVCLNPIVAWCDENL